jgi:TonB family protein
MADTEVAMAAAIKFVNIYAWTGALLLASFHQAGAATDDFERQVEQMTDLVLQALPVTDAFDPALVAMDPNWPMSGQRTKVDPTKLACVRADMTAASYRRYKRAAVREYALADRKRFTADLKLLSSGAAKFLGEYLAQRNEDERAHRQPRELPDAAARSPVPGAASLVSDEKHRSLRTLIGLPSSSGYSADGFFADGEALDAFIQQAKRKCNIPIPRERETVVVKTYVPPPSATEMTFAPRCLNPIAPQSINQGTNTSANATAPRSDPRRPLMQPLYPPASVARGEQGQTVVDVYVTEEGLVQTAKVRKSSGFPALDVEVLKATGTWQLIPGQLDGKPACAWANFALTFKLDGQDQPDGAQ